MKILLIEDDAENADYIANGLREEGHLVARVASGAEGLICAMGCGFDLLIVDRMIPGLDGLALVKNLRAAGHHTPVLFLTALGGVEDRVSGLNAGGDDYLVKPFAFSELVARVAALGRRPRTTAAETRLQVRDLELDLLSRTVRQRGVLIELQPREFRLLEYLMRHAGQVVTRTMLLEHVWDIHFDPRTNVVETHISRLRTKVDKGFEAELIHTLEGQGIVSAALPRILQTSSFRLTLLYAALFGISLLILLGIVYGASGAYMSSSLDAAVDSDITELEDSLQIGGNGALTEEVKERVRQMPQGPMYYLLQDTNEEVVAGNIPPFHGGDGRFDLKVPKSNSPSVAVRAHGITLSDHAYLMVGVDALPRREMQKLILRVFGWSSATTLMLAFAAGALMSGGLLRRIETISRTARDIMAGDFSRRIPVRGTGDELDHLVASLNAMLERNEAAMESLRQVSNDIAHDLRTPLTRLRQRLDLAQRRARSADEWRRAAEGCISEMDAILETFGGLLRVAQIESGMPTRRFAKVDLSELLRTVVEVYQPMAEEKEQPFTADIVAGLTVWGDRELLTQMIANVIENAMKHSPTGASIGLVTSGSSSTIAVAVSDNGPGIPAEERARVFQRFYRLERSRGTPGSGLGLSLVDAIAALHQMGIELTDNGPGLRVTLRFHTPDKRRLAGGRLATPETQAWDESRLRTTLAHASGTGAQEQVLFD